MRRDPKVLGDGMRRGHWSFGLGMGDPKVLGGEGGGSQSCGVREETMELWGWEWGTLKLWGRGEGGPQSAGGWDEEGGDPKTGGPKAVGNGGPQSRGAGEWGEGGIPKLWGEEGTLELWGWEWGTPKCWGMGGFSKLWGEETMELWGWEWGTPRCWGMG